jgi:hypothetical protein
MGASKSATIICYSFVTLEFRTGHQMPLMHLQPPRASLIEHLDLTGNFNFCDAIIFITSCSTHLRTLCWMVFIGFEDYIEHIALETLLNKAAHLPQLENLWVHGSIPRVFLGTILAPKLKLLHVDMGCVFPQHHQPLLKDPLHFTALHRFRCTRRATRDISTVPPFLLANHDLEEVGLLTLQELEATMNYESTPGTVTLPNLRHLWLTDTWGKGAYTLDTYIKLFQNILDPLIVQCVSSARPPFVAHVVQEEAYKVMGGILAKIGPKYKSYVVKEPGGRFSEWIAEWN